MEESKIRSNTTATNNTSTDEHGSINVPLMSNESKHTTARMIPTTTTAATAITTTATNNDTVPYNEDRHVSISSKDSSNDNNTNQGM